MINNEGNDLVGFVNPQSNNYPQYKKNPWQAGNASTGYNS